MESGIQSGIQAFQNAMKRGKSVGAATASGTGGGAPRLDFLFWREGDTKILRFLTDDIKIVEAHQYVICNDGKKRRFLVDEEDYVAKYASATPGVGWVEEYGTGKLIPSEPRLLGINAAVLRTERPAGKGRTEVVDDVHDLALGSKTYRARTFGVVIENLNTFWEHLDAYLPRYGTLIDRDYEIKRTSTRPTVYRVVALDPVEELRDAEVMQRHYGYGREWPRRPDDDADEAALREYDERFMYCPETLDDWVSRYSSEEWARQWLLPAGANGNGTVTAAATPVRAAADEAQSGGGSSYEDFARLRRELIPGDDPPPF